MRSAPILAALVCTGAAALDAPAVVGAHLVSDHANNAGKNNQNPGLFGIWANGTTAGFYRNSHRTWSAYAGQQFATNRTAPVSAALTIGAVAGYPESPVMPLVVGTLTLRVSERDSISLNAIPKSRFNGVAVFHLTAERRF